MELQVLNAQGEATATVSAPATVFGREFNEALVHQLVIAYQANARQGTRAQKDRAMVKHSTKKPWRQKGTGRARAGMTSSPIWRGGGRTFLAKVEGQKYETLFTLAIMSGARQGELLALMWSDVDWHNSQLNIKRTFQHGRFYEPKSGTSRRKIDLGPTVMAKLKKWKLACPPNELDLIFPNDEGKPIDNNNLVRRHFEPSLRRAGLRKIRFHDLRHTYASLLIDQGEHPKYIQAQMGHSSINARWILMGT